MSSATLNCLTWMFLMLKHQIFLHCLFPFLYILLDYFTTTANKVTHLLLSNKTFTSFHWSISPLSRHSCMHNETRALHARQVTFTLEWPWNQGFSCVEGHPGQWSSQPPECRGCRWRSAWSSYRTVERRRRPESLQTQRQNDSPPGLAQTSSQTWWPRSLQTQTDGHNRLQYSTTWFLITSPPIFCICWLIKS